MRLRRATIVAQLAKKRAEALDRPRGQAAQAAQLRLAHHVGRGGVECRRVRAYETVDCSQIFFRRAVCVVRQ